MWKKMKIPEKTRLSTINPYLTCFICKGYYVDATTISECLHSFCRSCIIKFLHEHSYCPICEVIINKAKPNLKLDKTLQDIVYKLVPELFLREMLRRREFYSRHPDAKTTPEERGEDFERTIFSPRDSISLSVEYMSDDSSPGAIPEKTRDDPASLRRFLQCPGMCRIEVLKKFIRNKYNVDTTKFYIDILYKRVPLPDHYTLIDIAYIYSWKRNEPMKFFFKITDINLVSDSYDYLIQTPKKLPEEKRQKIRVVKKVKSDDKIERAKSAEAIPADDKIACAITREGPFPVASTEEKKIETPIVTNEKLSNPLIDKLVQKKQSEVHLVTKAKSLSPKATSLIVAPKPKTKSLSPVTNKAIKNKLNSSGKLNSSIDKLHASKSKLINQLLCEKFKPPAKQVEEKPRPKTLLDEAFDRLLADSATNDLDKEKEPKDSEVDEAKAPKKIEEEKKDRDDTKQGTIDPQLSPVVRLEKMKLADEKPKEVETITRIQKVSNRNGEPIGFKVTKEAVPKKGIIGKTSKKETAADRDLELEKSNFLKAFNLQATKLMRKRKNCTKSERKAKKPKVALPNVKRIVSNVQQNASNVSKIVEQSVPAPELKSLFDNYKINIPSSLSVTVKTEKDEQVPSTIQKPVQNYIEIVKLPEVKKEAAANGSKEPKEAKNKPTFQKMFEDSLKRQDFLKSVEEAKKKQQADENGKKGILEIASQLSKKQGDDTKKKKEDDIVPVTKGQQTIANLCSPTLGMNYSVSVAQQDKGASGDTSHALTPFQLIEKYRIQNLAQLTANFNLANFCMGNALTPVQQEMVLRHFEMQNRQNWYNVQDAPRMQYEKYLKSIGGPIVGKEN